MAKNNALKQADYWRRCRRLTVFLLLIWFAVSFGSSYYARELDAVSLFGFPLGFYMAAQGALLVYLAIVGCYAWVMNRLDGNDDDGDDSGD